MGQEMGEYHRDNFLKEENSCSLSTFATFSPLRRFTTKFTRSRAICNKKKHLPMSTTFTTFVIICTFVLCTNLVTSQEHLESETESRYQSSELRVKRDSLLTTSPPRFTHLFQEEILDPGSKCSLKCEAVGSPLPQITWTLDGSQIVESHSRIRIGDYVTNQGVVNSFINLTSVRIEDGGLYSCSGKIN